jgi:hypothetical protein
MSEDLVMLFCPTCGEERLTEVPPCPDGHGSECPDRACVECGTALLFDAVLLAAARGRSGERRNSGAHRRVARDAQGA